MKENEGSDEKDFRIMSRAITSIILVMVWG